MYIETSSGRPGDKAEITSYRYFVSSPNCRMTLWYHMYGSGVGQLDVKIKKSDGTYDIKYSVAKNQVTSWLLDYLYTISTAKKTHHASIFIDTSTLVQISLPTLVTNITTFTELL